MEQLIALFHDLQPQVVRIDHINIANAGARLMLAPDWNLLLAKLRLTFRSAAWWARCNLGDAAEAYFKA